MKIVSILLVFIITLFSADEINNSPVVSSTPIDKGSYIIPALVKIKAGSFMMGSYDGDKDEKPVHRVNINYDFYIGKYEVTNNEFVKFLNNGNL